MFIKKKYNYSALKVIGATWKQESNWFRNITKEIVYNYDVDCSRKIEMKFFDKEGNDWAPGEDILINSSIQYTTKNGSLFNRAIDLRLIKYVNSQINKKDTHNNKNWDEYFILKRKTLNNLKYIEIYFPVKC